MLRSFRRSSWLLLAFLGLALIALVITGFGTGGSGLGDIGGGPGRLATVGDEVISEQDIINRLNRELKVAQREHADLDMARFIQIGAFEDVLEQEIVDRAQFAFAAKQNIVASKRMVDGEIAAVPAFQNAAGEFDEAGFRTALAQAGVTEAQLRRDVMLDLLRQQMLMPLAQGARLPSSVLNFYATLLLETRTGAVAVVPNQAVGPGTAPTEAEIAAYFRSHEARYRIPERRVLRYALFGWTDVVNAVQATDAEIEAAYKEASATYGPKETRAIAQLTLPDQTTANSFVAKVKAGTSFPAAATEAGFAPGDIVRAEGTREEVAREVAPQVAQAAFAGAQGATIGPIRSPLGWHVARIERVTIVPGKPLAAVRGELASSIQQRKAAEALDNLVTKIEDALTDGASFDEVVKANNLQAVDTQPVTAAGAAHGSDYQLSAELKPLLKPGFELGTDDDPQVETITPGQRYALLAVRSIVDPAMPPLAEVRDRINADMIAERSAERAKNLADELVAKINAGTAIRAAMAGAGIALPPVQPVRMRRADVNRGGEQVPPPVRAIFGLPKGKARVVATPNGEGWFVVVAEEITPGDPKDVPALAQELKQPFDDFQREEYVAQLVRAMERAVEIKRNEAAIRQLKQRLQSGGSL